MTGHTHLYPASESALLPCPFCGGVGLRGYAGPLDGSGVWPIVFCATCKATTDKSDSYNIAVERWNARAPQSGAGAQTGKEPDGYRAAWLEMIERCNKLKEENFHLRTAKATSLSDFTDAQLRNELHARAMMVLGDQTIGVTMPISPAFSSTEQK
jgi:Lar family restriction alleviation protein